MAAYIPVPRDLTRVKTKVFLNLTKRQLICFGLAALIGVPSFFFIKSIGSTSLAAMSMIIIMIPMFLLAMYERDGQPLEVIAKNFIESKFIRPKIRPYDLFVPDFVKEAEEQIAKEVKLPTQEEVTIKFGKGLAEPFQSKDGREFMRITIPNQDPADKTPWASFVLPAKAVHENQYGKGLWAKIPADGTTVVTKPTLQGQDDKGKNIWQDVKTQVPNRDLKAMVESYKARTPHEKATQPRESAREKLDALVKDTAAKVSIDKSKRTKAKTKGPEL